MDDLAMFTGYLVLIVLGIQIIIGLIGMLVMVFRK